MTDFQAAFHLLVTAARQARLTADEHIAVSQAAQQVQAALMPAPPPAPAPPADAPPVPPAEPPAA